MLLKLLFCDFEVSFLFFFPLLAAGNNNNKFYYLLLLFSITWLNMLALVSLGF